jgi:hypothetical protein
MNLPSQKNKNPLKKIHHSLSEIIKKQTLNMSLNSIDQKTNSEAQCRLFHEKIRNHHRQDKSYNDKRISI